VAQLQREQEGCSLSRGDPAFLLGVFAILLAECVGVGETVLVEELTAGAGVVARGGVRIETISSERAFERLPGSWDELVRAMPRPSPFLLHSWLLEWWRHYGAGHDLAVHVAYRDDRLVAALPLYVRHRSGLRVGEFVGGTWAFLADLLVEPGEESSARPLLEHAGSSRHDFMNLFGLPGSSRLVAALPPTALHLVERLEAPVLDLSAAWETVYRTKLSAKARRRRRRRLRQLQELGTVDVSIARTREELEPALEEVFRVHALRWRGQRGPSGFVSPTGIEFHRAALLRLADQGVPRLTTISLDGRVVAFALALQLSGRTYGLTRAFDPEYARFSPGTEAKLRSLEAAAEEGVVRAEFLGAAGPHNRALTDRYEPIYEGIGLAQTLRGRAAAQALLGGIRVRRAVKRSETARKLYYRVRSINSGPSPPLLV
jgi:CelD/BcsL family acetyltransferase involved in cellulose biosynthesis